MVEAPLICVVDDDQSVRESLQGLLRAVGLRVHAFSSAHDFLRSTSLHAAACLLLDVHMPDMTGPELQRELAARSLAIPIIVITARNDKPILELALRNGALNCFMKPFDEDALIAAIRVACAS